MTTPITPITPIRRPARKSTPRKPPVKDYYAQHQEMFEKDTLVLAKSHRFHEVAQEYLAYGRFLERHPEALIR